MIKQKIENGRTIIYEEKSFFDLLKNVLQYAFFKIKKQFIVIWPIIVLSAYHFFLRHL